jgi:hypothetical protein
VQLLHAVELVGAGRLRMHEDRPRFELRIAALPRAASASRMSSIAASPLPWTATCSPAVRHERARKSGCVRERSPFAASTISH